MAPATLSATPSATPSSSLELLHAACRRCALSFYGAHKRSKFVQQSPGSGSDDDAGFVAVSSTWTFVRSCNSIAPTTAAGRRQRQQHTTWGDDAFEQQQPHCADGAFVAAVIRDVAHGQRRGSGSGCSWTLTFAGALASRMDRMLHESAVGFAEEDETVAMLGAAAGTATDVVRELCATPVDIGASADQARIDYGKLAGACAHGAAPHVVASVARAAAILRLGGDADGTPIDLAHVLERRLFVARIVASGVNAGWNPECSQSTHVCEGLLLPVIRGRDVDTFAGANVVSVCNGAHVVGRLEGDGDDDAIGSHTERGTSRARREGKVAVITFVSRGAVDGVGGIDDDDEPGGDDDAEKVIDGVESLLRFERRQHDRSRPSAIAANLHDEFGVRVAIFIDIHNARWPYDTISGYANAGILCVTDATRRNIDAVAGISGAFQKHVPLVGETCGRGRGADAYLIHIGSVPVCTDVRWGWRSQRTVPNTIDDGTESECCQRHPRKSSAKSIRWLDACVDCHCIEEYPGRK